MKGISPERMTEHMDTVFWYVFDETNRLVVAAPDTESEGVSILFLKKQDAQKWKSLVSSAPAYKDVNLSVQGDRFRSIYEESLDYPEFRVLPIASKGAEEFLSHYNGEYTLTSEQEDNHLRWLFEERGQRAGTHVLKEDLLNEPTTRVDETGRTLWVFQILPGIFDPEEGHFSYDDEVYIVEITKTDNTVICRRI